MNRTQTDELLHSSQVLIVMGTGGVGKTTASAALAYRAAVLGKRTVVLTIDPSMRLKSLFHLEKPSEEPVSIPLEDFISGSLSALLPSTKHVFSHFLDKLTEDEELKSRILKNRIFRVFSQEFSGAQEYMALKRVEMLVASNHYDLIIVDTPPAENTLEFLDAPKLLGRLFEEGLLQRLLGQSSRLLSFGINSALSVLKKLTSAHFFSDLIEFSSALFEVRERFKENLDRIERTLHADTTRYLVVTTPREESIHSIQELSQYLQNSERSLAGVLLNRTLSALPSESPTSTPSNPEWFHSLLEDERRVLGLFQNQLKITSMMLPELNRDILSLEDLYVFSNAFQDPS